MMRQQMNLVDSDTTQAFPTSAAHSYEGDRWATTARGPANRITGLAGHFWTAGSGLFSRVRELPYSAPFRCAVPSVSFERIQISAREPAPCRTRTNVSDSGWWPCAKSLLRGGG